MKTRSLRDLLTIKFVCSRKVNLLFRETSKYIKHPHFSNIILSCTHVVPFLLHTITRCKQDKMHCLLPWLHTYNISVIFGKDITFEGECTNANNPTFLLLGSTVNSTCASLCWIRTTGEINMSKTDKIVHTLTTDK